MDFRDALRALFLLGFGVGCFFLAALLFLSAHLTVSVSWR